MKFVNFSSFPEIERKHSECFLSLSGPFPESLCAVGVVVMP